MVHPLKIAELARSFAIAEVLVISLLVFNVGAFGALWLRIPSSIYALCSRSGVYSLGKIINKDGDDDDNDNLIITS